MEPDRTTKLKTVCETLTEMNREQPQGVNFHLLASYKVDAKMLDQLADSGITYTSYDNSNMMMDVDALTEWLIDQAAGADPDFVKFITEVHDAIPIHMDLNFHL